MNALPLTNGLIASHYDRSRCAIGVVHIGVSAFHRAHEAVYFDRLMQQTGDLRWGIAGVNLRPGQSNDCRRLALRDGKYVLKTVATDGSTDYAEIRSIVKLVDHAERPQDAQALLALPSVHMASITVTESGYYFTGDNKLNLQHPDIADEVCGGAPNTVYGYLRAGLIMRMEAGGAPITILSCDNLRMNGQLLEDNFMAYLAALNDRRLTHWVRANVTFPCAMVDRITPRPTAELSAEIESLFNIKFDSSVFSERFSQWVIEDNFAGARPDLDKAGAQLVSDVFPYEEAKIRLLNGGHSSVAYFGALKGYRDFGAAIRDPELSAFFDVFEAEEAAPALGDGYPIDFKNYVAMIKERFMNPYVVDSIERICMDGANKMAIFIRPTIVECYEKSIDPRHAISVVASWYVFMRLVAMGKPPVPYYDPYFDDMRHLFAPDSEKLFAKKKFLWKDLPQRYPQFVDSLAAAIAEIEKKFIVA